MAYFLISVSSRKNLDLCIRYGLAGFTNSINGVWTYSDIREEDFISFLYAAKVHNLYQVKAKEAINQAQTVGPWEPITFKMSGLTYYFLGATGARDFAGSGVVHMVGGLAAFIGAAMLGPRIGKFNKDGTPNAIKGHNLPFVVIGTFILFFGWFGFNPGSTLAATDLRISVIAVNTFLAGVTGAVVALYWVFTRTGKMDITAGCNGCLAGLVAITAPCAFVAPWAAVVIGAISVPFLFATAHVVERVLKVDDPVGAVPVHFGGGLWGLLAVGIFADGTYLEVKGLITGEVGQLLLQLVDIGALIAWVAPTMFLTFWLVKKTIGLRASREEELQGLDIPEHGIEAYPAD